MFTYWYINKFVPDFELWKTDELNSRVRILPTICYTLHSIFTQSLIKLDFGKYHVLLIFICKCLYSEDNNCQNSTIQAKHTVYILVHMDKQHYFFIKAISERLRFDRFAGFFILIQLWFTSLTATALKRASVFNDLAKYTLPPRSFMTWYK